MCGIIGYVGTESALPVVADGLKRLEYRGYDSVGLALVGDDLEIHKGEGDIDSLELPSGSSATCGIGHTRWATHGEPTATNAHPHVDCTGSVAVVHNGIIGNHEALRAELDDHRFASETDTEVIPHLIEEERSTAGSLREAVAAATERLEGSYAIAVVAAGEDRIVAARNRSPLVVGRGEDCTVVASDAAALLDHTRRVTFLEDGDVAEITADSISVFAGGAPVERPASAVDWDRDAAEKGAYVHFMLKEIHEQPHVLRQTLAGRIDAAEGRVDLDVSLPGVSPRSIDAVHLVACGTSYHACLYARYLFRELTDVPVTAEVASEYEFAGRDPGRTLVVAVTQSGETADTLRAIRSATAAGAPTLGVTNTVGSTIEREVDATIHTRAGPEISVAATKTFAAQVSTLAMLGVHLATVRDGEGATAVRDLLDDLERLPDAIQGTLDHEGAVAAAAERYLGSDAFFFVGRRLGYPVALEGALKLKEITYDHAEGFPAGELKHGPLALVSGETPVVAILTRGSRPEETLNNVTEIQSRGAPVIGCVSRAEFGESLEECFTVPDCGLLEPLVANVYLQLFAYHVATLKGREIDKPRNLAKSVTVE